jgi:predicted  nucleic acid-binding Zn-ribbon protein
MTDRLALTRAFEGAGLKTDQAERIATEIYDAIHDNVATKTDLRNEVAVLRTDLRELEQRTELRFEKLERQIDRMVVRLGALVVIVAGLLSAAVQHWPPR